MPSMKFIFILSLIILFGFTIRIIPLFDNNFYFTIDQGYDAVNAREIFSRGQILIRGPETSIHGLFAGPLWFYFLALGLFLFSGHPAGGVIILIILNLFLTTLIILVIKKEISSTLSLFVGLFLQIYWYFYDTSRYAFNPFPLVFITFCIIFFLQKALKGQQKFFLFAAVFVGLSFHFEIAFAIVLALLYVAIGLFLYLKKHLSFTKILLGLAIIFIFLLPNIYVDLTSSTSEFEVFKAQLQEKDTVFLGNSFIPVLSKMAYIIGRSAIPQNYYFGLAICSITVFLFWKTNPRRKHLFIYHLFILSGLLLMISILFFGTNKGWNEWRMVGIPILLFFTLLLIISTISSRYKLFLYSIVFLAHSFFFITRYTEYLKPQNDSSMLNNQLSTIDWIYSSAHGEGFSVYIQLTAVYDYTYQYLIWWRGLNKYGYLPCEYSTYPDSPEDIIIPGWKYYQSPHKCSSLRYLIIAPDKSFAPDQNWITGTTRSTKLLDSHKIGRINIEKRELLSR